MVGLDWTEITAELVFARLFTFVGIVQLTYQTADVLIEGWLDDNGKGLNDLDAYRPERGISERSFTGG